MAQQPEVSEEDKNRKMNQETFREAMKIFEFVKPYRWSLIIGMILLFVSSMVFMLFPYLIGKMMDIATGVDFHGMDLNDIFWLMFVVLIAQGVVSYFRVLLFARLSEKGIADLRIALYEKLVSLPIVFYEENRVGELMSRKIIQRIFDYDSRIFKTNIIAHCWIDFLRNSNSSISIYYVIDFSCSSHFRDVFWKMDS
jgi:ABC-type multidrug transport system fused ATPase/permease subunit